jgi:hypothetical protein
MSKDHAPRADRQEPIALGRKQRTRGIRGAALLGETPMRHMGQAAGQCA